MKSEGDGGKIWLAVKNALWYNSGQMGIQVMRIQHQLVNMDRELPDGTTGRVSFTFTISNGLVNTHGDVVLTDGGYGNYRTEGQGPKDSRENRFGKAPQTRTRPI